MSKEQPKQVITEADNVHAQWFVDAKTQTLATLPEFLRHLSQDYAHDYGTICHALSAAAVAAATAMDKSETGGITGFQAGCVMWGFVAHWLGEVDKPMRLMKYENLLYPQYATDFAKTVTPDTARWVKEQAKAKLAEVRDGDDFISPTVVAHWRALANGILPFGFTVEER